MADANIVIAHNANFDRKFAERYWPEFEHKNWGCSATEIDWRAHGFEGSALQRNLLYTGVTRGKRLVVLVGQKKAVAIAVRNVSGRRRWSKLGEWLALGNVPTPRHSSMP